jgi:hypothetical protein
MSDLLKSNFQHAPVEQTETNDSRGEYRRKALDAIIGSMVFVEDRLLYWDLADE